MVRPHVAVVTTVEPVHLEFFGTVEEIAEAKAEIFAGPGAGRRRRAPSRQPALRRCCASRASEHGAQIVSFGCHEEADVRALKVDRGCRRAPRSSPGTARSASPTASARRARTTCAELARRARRARRRSAPMPCAACRRWRASARPPGRGARTLLDAPDGQHPAHRRELQRQSGLDARGAGRHGDHAARSAFARRIAVLGDMLELGEDVRGPASRRSRKRLTRPGSIWSLPVAR